MFLGFYHSPIGHLVIKATESGICSISLRPKDSDELVLENKHTSQGVIELRSYFAGKLKSFSVELDLGLMTDYSKQVLEKVMTIPYGRTQSYLDIALKMGDKNAVRAVGNANRKNPIPIIIPCHRVIGSNGSLVGYVYGIDKKAALLAHEAPQSYALQGDLFT